MFSGRADAPAADREAELSKLHAKIGELVVERVLCGRPPENERVPEARDDRSRSPTVVDRRQCRPVAISRSAFYGTAKGESPLNLALMRRIDEPFLEAP